MKKCFIFLLTVILIQITPALAKEVYVGTRYGLEFYVDTALIEYTHGNTFYVTVNEYLGDDL